MQPPLLPITLGRGATQALPAACLGSEVTLSSRSHTAELAGMWKEAVVKYRQGEHKARTLVLQKPVRRGGGGDV
jgi:hypothetical protein